MESAAHDHEGSAGGSHAGHEEEMKTVYKCMVLLGAIYAFYLFETITHILIEEKNKHRPTGFVVSMHMQARDY